MIAADFTRFMQEVHGHPPFPWQRAAVDQILRSGSWPAMVDVPTGLGKTAMLDIAVFVMAMGACGRAPAGLGRRRIFFVVDRRLVVDQAEEHALRIAEALATAPAGSICAEIAQLIGSLSGVGTADVLQVVKMRGGTTWDAAWLPRPDLPAIVTGTVDQVGSRLFFRGYGVSPRRRPIDAALVGTDSVILIDEAHLAQSLTATLAAAHSLDTPSQVVLPASVVHLSATLLTPTEGWVTHFDEEMHLADPVARGRLQAPKSLVLVETEKTKANQDLVDQAVRAAQGGHRRVLVVCNTVDRARAVHESLGKSLPTDTELLLLIGRSRPLDRELIAQRVTELFGASRVHSKGSAVLVATQTVEVGIDLDATDLVTETASWDALIQRIGRVNRRGTLASASVVVVEDNDPSPPVYGQAKLNTAAFLREALSAGNELDVSPLALRRIPTPPGLTSPAPLLPLLLPAQLDAWARTSPAPTNDPPLDPYLHGIDRALAPVAVAWREGLQDGAGELLPASTAGAAVDSLPVRAEELVEIPLAAVRRWLRGEKPLDIGDTADVDEDIPFRDGPQGMALRRSAGESGSAAWEWVTDDQLRPGDLIIVPAELGGLDRFGWAPLSKVKVRDVAELAALRRGQPALRLDGGLPVRLGLPDLPTLWDLVTDWRNSDDPETGEELEAQVITATRSWLDRQDEPAGDSCWSRADLAALRTSLADKASLVLSGNEASPVLSIARPERTWQSADEDSSAGTCALDRRVTLAAHLSAVGARAARIAELLRLPEQLVRTICDAARWHDLGKVDIRFQAMLFGGDRLSAELADEPLAKSGMPAGDLLQHQRASQRSGLPRGARHEAWSEALVAEYLRGLQPAYPGDPELVCHLVASHHGHARPLLPPVLDGGGHKLTTMIDDARVSIPLPSGVRLADADRFARLNARYGRWGLALLEAIVRCADMTVSSEGS